MPLAVGSAASSTRPVGVGFDSVTVKVWSGSSVLSSFTGTVNFFVVSPFVIVTVPVFVVPRSAVLAESPFSIDAVQSTVTSAGAAADSVSVNSTPSSSSPSASATLRVGMVASLSTIVPLPVASEIVALSGLDSVTVKVSLDSTVVSSVVDTVSVFAVSPAVKVSFVAATAVKSPAPAVSPVSADAAQSTVTCLPLAGDSSTVNSTPSPSAADAGSTLSVGSGSSSVILPCAVTWETPPAKPAFSGLDSVTVKVSRRSPPTPPGSTGSP